MHIVIDIPEELKNKIDNANEDNYRTYLWWFETTLYCAIKDGIPLPKGYGRLIDANELDNDLKERQKSYEHDFSIRQPINEAIEDGIIIARTHVNNAPTIIEADKKSEG